MYRLRKVYLILHQISFFKHFSLLKIWQFSLNMGTDTVPVVTREAYGWLIHKDKRIIYVGFNYEHTVCLTYEYNHNEAQDLSMRKV
jgi:hypothetical protein